MSEQDLARLIALLESKLGAEWRAVTDWIREQNDLGDIEARIRRGDFAGAVQLVEQAALRMASSITASYIEAGQAAARALDERPQTAGRLIRFDVENQRAIDYARRNKLELVQGFTAEQRETNRVIIADGVARGANPREVARDVRNGLGLTPTQAQHVQNYRRALEQGDWARALGYELRDARSDRTINRLARDGGALTPEQVDRMVGRYREGYVAYRSEVIARTEALRAAHQGTEETMRQAVERGDIRADQLVREWHTAGDGRTRDSHRAMDGQRRKFGEPFETARGVRLMYPGDPSAPVAETAQCRCSVSTTVEN